MRYARHVMLEEIGVAGQARLESETIELAGEASARATATLYLERAGVRVAVGGRPIEVPRVRAGRPELEVAAAFLAGAWAAVEAIKASVGAGCAAEAPRLELSPEEEPRA